jgi:hypothetical protein
MTCAIPRKIGFDRDLIKPDGSDAQVEKKLTKIGKGHMDASRVGSIG